MAMTRDVRPLPYTVAAAAQARAKTSAARHAVRAHRRDTRTADAIGALRSGERAAGSQSFPANFRAIYLSHPLPHQFLSSSPAPSPSCTMASALRLGSSALRASTRAPARSVAFNGLRCYSSKTSVSFHCCRRSPRLALTRLVAVLEGDLRRQGPPGAGEDQEAQEVRASHPATAAGRH